MLRIATVLLCLSPAITAAQCLTSEALDDGISVAYANGNTSYIQRQPDGSILDAYDETSSYFQQTIFFASSEGIFENGWVVHERGKWEIQDVTNKSYDFAPDTVPPFSAESSGHGTITWADNRYDSGDKTYSWMGYESEPLVLDDCSYDAVRVFTYELDISAGEFYVREIKYLPALGVGLQLGNSYFGFSPDNGIIVSITPS